MLKYFEKIIEAICHLGDRNTSFTVKSTECFVLWKSHYRWEKTHGLLIEGGLTYDAIKKSVADATISFRDGVVQLFEFLEVSCFLLNYSFPIRENLNYWRNNYLQSKV